MTKKDDPSLAVETSRDEIVLRAEAIQELRRFRSFIPGDKTPSLCTPNDGVDLPFYRGAYASPTDQKLRLNGSGKYIERLAFEIFGPAINKAMQDYLAKLEAIADGKEPAKP